MTITGKARHPFVKKKKRKEKEKKNLEDKRVCNSMTTCGIICSLEPLDKSEVAELVLAKAAVPVGHFLLSTISNTGISRKLTGTLNVNTCNKKKKEGEEGEGEGEGEGREVRKRRKS